MKISAEISEDMTERVIRFSVTNDENTQQCAGHTSYAEGSGAARDEAWLWVNQRVADAWGKMHGA